MAVMIGCDDCARTTNACGCPRHEQSGYHASWFDVPEPRDVFGRPLQPYLQPKRDEKR